jgi:hypothetical protein
MAREMHSIQYDTSELLVSCVSAKGLQRLTLIWYEPFALLRYLTHLTDWYPLFSNTLRNRTSSPDAVNMTTKGLVTTRSDPRT